MKRAVMDMSKKFVAFANGNADVNAVGNTVGNAGGNDVGISTADSELKMKSLYRMTFRSAMDGGGYSSCVLEFRAAHWSAQSLKT